MSSFSSFEIPSQAALDAHLADASDAHDASAISIADAGGNTSETDVEGAIAELYDLIDALSAGAVTASGCSVYRNGTFSHNSSGNFLFPDMDTEVFDTDGYHSTVTNPSRITIPTGFGGMFVITGAVWWDTNTTGARYCMIYKNGTTELSTVGQPAANPLRQEPTVIVELADGDYVQLGIYQSSGGTRTAGDPTNDAALYIQLARIGS